MSSTRLYLQVYRSIEAAGNHGRASARVQEQGNVKAMQ
jgi:hypothetical protein